MQNNNGDFHIQLQNIIDEFVHLVYELTRKFPKEEMFGAQSQARRSALSVALNYVEGFARRKVLVRKNFFETSYGSLKESVYM